MSILEVSDMKKLIILFLLVAGSLAGFTQNYFNPNVAIKPIATLSVYKIQRTKESTRVTLRIRNQNQVPPFALPSDKLLLRTTGEPEAYRMIGSENAPILPKKHVFSFKDEVLEFTLIFPPMPDPVKYLDIVQEDGGEQFYLQGIILDTDMNNEIARGFREAQNGNNIAALEAFKNVAEMDPYFEFGLAHFNVIYLLAAQKNWKEAGEWYKKFKERFFYDKTLLEGELARMGIIPRLEAGR